LSDLRRHPARWYRQLFFAGWALMGIGLVGGVIATGEPLFGPVAGGGLLWTAAGVIVVSDVGGVRAKLLEARRPWWNPLPDPGATMPVLLLVIGLGWLAAGVAGLAGAMS
jgi:hypothetical protein